MGLTISPWCQWGLEAKSFRENEEVVIAFETLAAK